MSIPETRVAKIYSDIWNHLSWNIIKDHFFGKFLWQGGVFWKTAVQERWATEMQPRGTTVSYGIRRFPLKTLVLIQTCTTDNKKKKKKNACTLINTCTHFDPHARAHRHSHKHTHANTDTDATKQQQPVQRSDANYCSCGVAAWRKCLWTADERRGCCTVRWHHAREHDGRGAASKFMVTQHDADTEAKQDRDIRHWSRTI